MTQDTWKSPRQGWIFQKIRWVEQVVYIAPAGPPARSKWVLERPVGQLRWLSEGDPRARPDQGKERGKVRMADFHVLFCSMIYNLTFNTQSHGTILSVLAHVKWNKASKDA